MQYRDARSVFLEPMQSSDNDMDLDPDMVCHFKCFGHFSSTCNFFGTYRAFDVIKLRSVHKIGQVLIKSLMAGINLRPIDQSIPNAITLSHYQKIILDQCVQDIFSYSLLLGTFIYLFNENWLKTFLNL